MVETIFKLILCHFIGDYVLQNDFIANTKGANLWHLIVHCFLYSLPFYVAFGFCWQIGVIIGIHFIVDALKAKWNLIDYVEDQTIHLAVTLVYFI